MSGVTDVTAFPYTVPAGTYFIVIGVYGVPAAGSGWTLVVKNASGDSVMNLGVGVYTDTTAYPYGLPLSPPSAYPILAPGDTVTATNITGMRLIQVNTPSPGEFLW